MVCLRRGKNKAGEQGRSNGILCLSQKGPQSQNGQAFTAPERWLRQPLNLKEYGDAQMARLRTSGHGGEGCGRQHCRSRECRGSGFFLAVLSSSLDRAHLQVLGTKTMFVLTGISVGSKVATRPVSRLSPRSPIRLIGNYSNYGPAQEWSWHTLFGPQLERSGVFHRIL